MAMLIGFVHSLDMIPPLAVYGFVLLWLAAESCGVPLPNELVLLLTGSLAAEGHISPYILVGVAVAGSLIGAGVAYVIGKVGGRAAVLRWGRFVRLDKERFASVEQWFARSGPIAIFLSRITPFVRTVASFPAGVLRMPLRKFFLATFVGSLIWCAVLVGVGDALGKDYTIALRLIQQYTIPAVIVLVVVIAGYLWLHNRLSHVGQAKTPAQQATQARGTTGKNAALASNTASGASGPLATTGAPMKATSAPHRQPTQTRDYKRKQAEQARKNG